MSKELRIDLGTLRPPTRRADGTLLVDGVLTRSGVFVYRDGAGKERREYRPPDEVFKADAMASFRLVPLTNDHPPELVTAQNARQFAVGAVGEPRRDGNHVVSSLAVFDAEAVADVEAGKRELSCGYHAEIVMESGVSPEGERYDAIQRGICGNHVAIVDIARAGREARIRMDAAVMVAKPARELRAESQEQTMKVRIDGVEYDVTEQVAQAIAKQEQALAAEKTRADAQTAAAAKAEGDLKGAQAEAAKEKARADALEASIDKRVTDRVALERQAGAVIGEDQVAGKSERDLKIAVVKKVDGDELPADAEPAYVQGRYDSAIKRAGQSVAELAAARTIVRADATGAHADADDDFDEDKAQQKSLERLDNAWKAPTKAAKSEEN